MIGSLLALLIVSAQPAPADEPVVDVQAEVQVAAEAAAPAEPEEEVVCRRRLVPSARIGQRARVIRDCRPASEWGSARRRR